MSFVKGEKPRDASYASGGAVLGRTREFLKEDTPYLAGADDTLKKAPPHGQKQTYPKGKGAARTGDKSLKAVKPRS